MNKLSIALLLTVSAAAFSQTPSEVLQSKLNNIRSMTASFSQTVKAKHRTVSHSSGTMALQRPGRFRWQTTSPMSQLMVADGQKIWVYDKDLEQVTVRRQSKGLGGTAALFLSGYDNSVARNFNVTQGANAQIFDLKSKSPRANFQRIRLTFSQNNLTGIEIYDQLGQTTIVHLSQAKSNPKLSAGLFQFTAPKRVDIVQQ